MSAEQTPFVKVKRASSTTDDDRWQEEQTAPTLNAFDNGSDTRATVVMPVIFDGTRHDDFRVYTDATPTLKQRMGTGGGQVPMVAEPIAFAQNQRDEVRDLNDVAGCLQAEPGMKQQTFVAQPVNFDEFNHTGGESVHHSIRSGRHSTGVAVPLAIDGTWWDGSDVAPSLTRNSVNQRMPDKGQLSAIVEPVVAPTLTAANDPSRSPQSTEVTNQVEAVYGIQYAVRRLTPVECERLMGWPDDHTRWRADGKEQADSHRYKQCGNGVASPVAEWIGTHILKAHLDAKNGDA